MASRSGIVLFVTLILLVILSTVGYTVTSRVLAQRHRDQYGIDYCMARYGCDSGVKYAMVALAELDPRLISRPNEPDFSDIFSMSEQDYRELLDELAAQKEAEAAEEAGAFFESPAISDVNSGLDVNMINALTEMADARADNELSQPQIQGPYGPAWPLVTEPAEFEIGSAKVKIEIEDENAKYPLGWALIDDENIDREVRAGFETFCEWARMDRDQIDSLEAELQEIGKIKPFQSVFKPITKIIRTTDAAPTTPSSTDRRLRRTPRTRITRKTISADDQAADQTRHFARLFHSSLIDRESLATPTVLSEARTESALKYMGTWGSLKVNINTAPRHVLEAAFMFGGDADKIAEEVIRLRKTKPIKDIDELKSSLFGYSNAIDKCANYITTTSTFFTIKVTAISGVAEASSIIAITKTGNKVRRVAVINS